MLIQKLRLQRGWSQQQLADLSGLSTRTIQRIENGHQASVESLKSLAAVFETDFNDLQGNTGMSDTTLQPAPTASSTHELLAFRRVRRKRSFFMHCIQFAVVMAGLFAINLLQPTHHWWVIWPAFGWGMGLLAHGLSTFELLPFLGAQWEKREVEKYLGRSL
ncbi:MAG: helix-turn-helix domain-containing protein [Aquabacterium sp.]